MASVVGKDVTVQAHFMPVAVRCLIRELCGETNKQQTSKMSVAVVKRLYRGVVYATRHEKQNHRGDSDRGQWNFHRANKRFRHGIFVIKVNLHPSEMVGDSEVKGFIPNWTSLQCTLEHETIA
jgi:hypothetical protein